MTHDTSQQTKFCPDCNAERPLAEFYRIKAATYAGGYRYSAYCKTHTKARTAAAAKKAAVGSGVREANRRASRVYAAKHTEQTRARVAAHRARRKAQADAPPAPEADEP
jgi:hypothetical protein